MFCFTLTLNSEPTHSGFGIASLPKLVEQRSAACDDMMICAVQSVLAMMI